MDVLEAKLYREGRLFTAKTDEVDIVPTFGSHCPGGPPIPAYPYRCTCMRGGVGREMNKHFNDV